MNQAPEYKIVVLGGGGVGVCILYMMILIPSNDSTLNEIKKKKNTEISINDSFGD